MGPPNRHHLILKLLPNLLFHLVQLLHCYLNTRTSIQDPFVDYAKSTSAQFFLELVCGLFKLLISK
ncbi:hypothetical protein QJS10_CPA06g01727 [Acorus calamus]|uniref:Uncharacterized protein n=1 Tax=Acorus calamus TaxID=4465 RepID=A0AAV9ERJ9_ACOCL|nr:hypothetical protein QJS10_CPA06g01727 [Acorus calamus]